MPQYELSISADPVSCLQHGVDLMRTGACMGLYCGRMVVAVYHGGCAFRTHFAEFLKLLLYFFA